MTFAGVVGQGAGIRRPDMHTKLLVRGWQPGSGANAFPEATGKSVTPEYGAELVASEIGTPNRFIGGMLKAITSNDSFMLADHSDWDLGTADWCIEAWINVYGLNGTYTMAFFSQDGGSPAQVLQVKQGGGSGIYTFRYSNTNNAYENTTTWTPGTGSWHHVAWVSYGTKWRLYIDGTLHGSEGDLNINGVTAAAPLRLFKSTGSTRNWWVFADSVRLTVGIPRYTGNFTPPTRRF